MQAVNSYDLRHLKYNANQSLILPIIEYKNTHYFYNINFVSYLLEKEEANGNDSSYIDSKFSESYLITINERLTFRGSQSSGTGDLSRHRKISTHLESAQTLCTASMS